MRMSRNVWQVICSDGNYTAKTRSHVCIRITLKATHRNKTNKNENSYCELRKLNHELQILLQILKIIFRIFFVSIFMSFPKHLRNNCIFEQWMNLFIKFFEIKAPKDLQLCSSNKNVLTIDSLYSIEEYSKYYSNPYVKARKWGVRCVTRILQLYGRPAYVVQKNLKPFAQLFMDKYARKFMELFYFGILRQHIGDQFVYFKTLAPAITYLNLCIHYGGLFQLLLDNNAKYLDNQIKRVLQWMLRVFFAAPIAFAIPIRDFTSSAVIGRGLAYLYCICGIGKVVTGFFARPLVAKEFFIVGFSMSACGEFAFILATASFAEGTIDQESFSAVLSVIVSPYALSFTISFFEKKSQKRMDDNIKQYEDTNLHPVYFAINTKVRGQWGHQDKLLHRIMHPMANDQAEQLIILFFLFSVSFVHFC